MSKENQQEGIISKYSQIPPHKKYHDCLDDNHRNVHNIYNNGDFYATQQ